MKLGQLAEAEHEAKERALQIAGIKREMRLYLAEHTTPASLEATRLRQLTEGLVEAHARYHAALATSTALREELGLPRYEAREK